jgi:outer membrane beta-barrel protein
LLRAGRGESENAVQGYSWIERRRALRTLLAAACALAVLAPVAARAQDDEGKLLAVQQRKFRINHELMVGGMFEPLDAFTKGVAPELAYVYHLDDAWSWEVLRGGYVAQLATSLRTQLERDFGVDPTQFESLQYYATSSLTWAPLYGKLALRNAKIIHAESYLSLGGALGRFTSSFQAGPEVGVGLRVFLSQLVSVRFDARDALFIHKSSGTTGAPINQVLFLSLGLSFALGSGE